MPEHQTIKEGQKAIKVSFDNANSQQQKYNIVVNKLNQFITAISMYPVV